MHIKYKCKIYRKRRVSSITCADLYSNPVSETWKGQGYCWSCKQCSYINCILEVRQLRLIIFLILFDISSILYPVISCKSCTLVISFVYAIKVVIELPQMKPHDDLRHQNSAQAKCANCQGEKFETQKNTKALFSKNYFDASSIVPNVGAELKKVCFNIFSNFKWYSPAVRDA